MARSAFESQGFKMCPSLEFRTHVKQVIHMQEINIASTYHAATGDKETPPQHRDTFVLLSEVQR